MKHDLETITGRAAAWRDVPVEKEEGEYNDPRSLYFFHNDWPGGRIEYEIVLVVAQSFDEAIGYISRRSFSGNFIPEKIRIKPFEEGVIYVDTSL